jgi:hypothetical protein
LVPSIRELAPQVFVAGVLPVVAYSVIRPYLSSDVEGLLLILVFPLAEIIFEARRSRRLEPIGIISLVGIALGVLEAVGLKGSTLMLKVRNSAITGGFGFGCLASLLLAKPAMWHLARAFATEGDPAKPTDFDRLWELPSVPGRFKAITSIWGAALVAEAALQVALALMLTTGPFLAASQALNATVLIALIVGTRAFVQASEPILRSPSGPLSSSVTGGGSGPANSPSRRPS